MVSQARCRRVNVRLFLSTGPPAAGAPGRRSSSWSPHVSSDVRAGEQRIVAKSYEFNRCIGRLVACTFAPAIACLNFAWCDNAGLSPFSFRSSPSDAVPAMWKRLYVEFEYHPSFWALRTGHRCTTYRWRLWQRPSRRQNSACRQARHLREHWSNRLRRSMRSLFRRRWAATRQQGSFQGSQVGLRSFRQTWLKVRNRPTDRCSGGYAVRGPAPCPHLPLPCDTCPGALQSPGLHCCLRMQPMLLCAPLRRPERAAGCAHPGGRERAHHAAVLPGGAGHRCGPPLR